MSFSVGGVGWGSEEFPGCDEEGMSDGEDVAGWSGSRMGNGRLFGGDVKL